MGHSTLSHKTLALEQLGDTGSLGFTADMLKELYGEVEREIKILEETSGLENLSMWLLLRLLQVYKGA